MEPTKQGACGASLVPMYRPCSLLCSPHWQPCEGPTKAGTDEPSHTLYRDPPPTAPKPSTFNRGSGARIVGWRGPVYTKRGVLYHSHSGGVPYHPYDAATLSEGPTSANNQDVIIRPFGAPAKGLRRLWRRRWRGRELAHTRHHHQQGRYRSTSRQPGHHRGRKRHRGSHPRL